MSSFPYVAPTEWLRLVENEFVFIKDSKTVSFLIAAGGSSPVAKTIPDAARVGGEVRW